MGPSHGQHLGRAWVAPGGCGPPAGDLMAPDLFLLGNNFRKFSAHSEKLSGTTLLKQKDIRKQELAPGILLIG